MKIRKDWSDVVATMGPETSRAAAFCTDWSRRKWTSATPASRELQ